jgi:hypothetical protein
MAVKFIMEFTNAQDLFCKLQFLVDDDIYSGEPIKIYGSQRPFVLNEFNNDLDIFKPIRPQQATIEILASASGVNINDFLVEDNDKAMKVVFSYGNYSPYWYGIVSQEDMSEVWIAQNHIITLRADDGFGSLKTLPLQDFDGNSIVGKYTPLELINYCVHNTAQSFTFAYVISNLFYTGMNTASKQTGLDQCKIDALTFVPEPDTYDDCYTVLEKINTAFNQTIFQYQGQWWVVRMAEFFIPQSGVLNGYQSNKPTVGQRGNILSRYMIDVGGDSIIKPIMPEMLKTLLKPSKTTSVSYSYTPMVQVLQNQTFLQGSFIGEIFLDDKYYFTWNVDNWDHVVDAGSGSYPASTKEFFRELVYGIGFEDEYVEIEVEDGTTASLIRSQPIRVAVNDVVTLSFKQLWADLEPGISPGESEVCMFVKLLTDSGTYYQVNSSGVWSTTISTAVFGVNRTVTNKDDIEYQEVTLTTNGIPGSGELTFGIYLQNTIGKFWKRVKDLKFEITLPINQQRTRVVKGDYHSYTISKNLNKSSALEIFVDDGYDNHKGTIYLSDGETRTSVLWNPRNYPSGPYPFKRHHALARWFYNRRYRNIIEGNFFGLEWEKDGTRYPIGLMNTIKFAEDSDKTFAIMNMREIDFMNGTWSADLVEIWDEDVDDSILPGVTDTHKWDIYFE